MYIKYVCDHVRASVSGLFKDTSCRVDFCPLKSSFIHLLPVFVVYTDVYVKVYMVYRGRRVSRKQTRVVTCGMVAQDVAVFNEALLFDVVPHQSLEHITVELMLVDCHRVTKDEFVGKLIVSPFDGEEWKHQPGDVPGGRCPLGGVPIGQHPALGGSDRPVAVWHRLTE